MDFLFNINVQFYIVSYLVGGIPFGLLLAKYFTGKDIRESGSGSIGATNVLRVLKETNPKLAKKLAILTVTLDALKGIGCDTAKSVLELDRDELVRRTDLEEETVDEIISILKSEFE